MISLLTDPKGIDVEIQRIQKVLHDSLSLKWAGELNAYGRVYQNLTKEEKIKPEHYKGNSGYEDVYFDDKFSCTFFFMDKDTHNQEDKYKYSSEVNLVFMVNLSKIHNETEMADARALFEVLEILNEEYNVNIESSLKYVRNVLKGMDISKIKFSDIHPLHCFGVKMKLHYDINEI